MSRFTPFVSKILATVIGLQMAALSFASAAPIAQAAGTADTWANYLVISEVLIREIPGGDNEFVELYNPTSQPIDISAAGLGLQLIVRDSSGNPVTVTLQPTAGRSSIVQPGSYFLIANDTGSYAANADATYLDADAQLEDDGSVAIATNAGLTVIDRVGWGAQPAGGYDTTAAANPAAGESLERKPGMNEGNGTDTNDNSTEFSVQSAPNPKTTLDATEMYAAPTVTDILPLAGYVLDSNLTVAATVTDSGSGIKPTGFSFSVDNVPVTSGFIYDAATNKVTFNTFSVAEGVHTLTLTVTDEAGFITTKTWTVHVDSVTPSATLYVADTTVTETGAAATVNLAYGDGNSDLSSGVHMTRIAFDGTLDTEAWVPATTTIVGTLPTREGVHTILAQVMDRAGNISSVAKATATVQAGVFPAPEYAISSTTGNTITITWPSVRNVAGYLVRYNDGQTLYGPVVTANPFITLSGLDMTKKYSFEIAAVSQFGTVSSFTKVFPPEISPAPAVKAARAAATAATVTNAVAETTTVVEEPVAAPQFIPRTEPTATPTVSPSPSPTATPEGEIKSGTETRQPDWTKVIVALSILIIAAGVATGGWYLYQWWTTQPKEKGKGKGGRW